MLNTPLAYLKNPWLRWLAEHGGEEIIGPLGPLVSESMPEKSEPNPSPWRSAVVQLVEAAQVKDLATRIAAAPQKSAMVKSANAAIEEIFDEWGCGTKPPGYHPWPWPGPPPWIWQIASALSFVANSFQAGGLRDEILGIAGQMVTRAGETGQAAHG
jgi:hypothetical protein